ncbi:MAG: efflux RND transporter periplasmic adaptor subunit [Proteobacteria bacterium]|jgi:membrane fusion protein, multidrug efflux system|nr:efflux RND transporter periplasmic adaptor subunit [Pseudomonadota bacterium]
MNKSYRTALIITALIIAVLFSGYLFPSEEAASTSLISQNNVEKPLMAVKIAVLQAQPYNKDIVLRGYTQSLRSVDLKSQIKGRVETLPIEKGERVKKGDVICRLEVEDHQANYVESLALVKQKELEFKASEELTAKGHRSETQHAAARASLDSALARSTSAKVNLDNITITAPFDGVINNRPIEVGDYMKEGEVCAVIMEEDPFLVVADISENYISEVNVGDNAHAILQNGRRLEGKIRYISAIANSSTRTFRVELEVDNPKKDILDGVTAELFIQADQVMAHSMSPAMLVLNDNGVIGVHLVDENNRVVFQKVEILGNHENGIWVSGIKDGSRLITEGQDFVKSGEEVKPVS